ncbi:MAG: class I SAM-dependent methyltransferase [candidate division WOR-3 bacterium]
MEREINVFQNYAKYYDLLYREKNYKAECDFIEEVFQRFSKLKIKNILELGCGTGGHAILLAKRGYILMGIDLSPKMLEIAKEKINKAGVNVDLYLRDIRNFRLNKRFDSAICMFAVLNYLIQNEDLERALKSVRRHLKEGGIFIFDIWNGLAVMRILPSFRVKIVEEGKLKLIRVVEPELQAMNHLSRNHYRLFVLEENKLIEEIRETHVIRFFFPQEIKYYLEKTGFEVLKICEFPKIDSEANENIWNIAVISRAI